MKILKIILYILMAISAVVGICIISIKQDPMGSLGLIFAALTFAASFITDNKRSNSNNQEADNKGIVVVFFCILFVIVVLIIMVVNIPSNKSQEPESSIVQSEDKSDIQGDRDENQIQESDSGDSDSYMNISEDIDTSESSCVSLNNVHWIEEKNIHTDRSVKTTRGEDWTDCIRFGSSNLNADGNAYFIAVCDRKYSKFTAEIAPQNKFDSSREVILYIYGVSEGKEIIRESYKINSKSKAIEINLNISDVEDLYFEKKGEYNLGIIAGQFINDYSGMGVLMKDATLYK